MHDRPPDATPVPPVAQPAEVAARLATGEAIRLLDVREPDEHTFVALPGSLLIPLGDLPSRIQDLDGWEGQEFVVYCHHGVRSAHAVAWLRSQGFNGARNLSGGIDRWSQEVDARLARY